MRYYSGMAQINFNHLKLAGAVAESGKKQKEIAAALDVHYNTISAWVTGQRAPLPGDLSHVLRFIGWTDEQIADLRMVDFYPLF